MTSKKFSNSRNFSSLSVKDLLEARDAYHIHLAHLEHVVATAIGRYLIKYSDPDSNEPKTDIKELKSEYDNKSPRTLENSKVKPWSWPCVLVFVDEWKQKEEFIKEPDQIVPSFLYLPDGRVVPTCVVFIEETEDNQTLIDNLTFPSELIGGGYPIVTTVQKEEHIASIGCLVTDGDLTYGLTNRHVTGDDDRKIYSLIRGERFYVGKSNKKQIGKKSFKEIYDEWPGIKVFYNLDVGLIEIDDVSKWTAQVFGIGEIDTPIDVNMSNITLDFIGCPVKAFGCASGLIEGEIQALFYRYKSIGGYDYISDLLIGSRKDSPKSFTTRHGDSGTIWFWDPTIENKLDGVQKYRPIALQWGGHRIISGSSKKQFQFALATFISNVCTQLDVELVRGWNIGFNEYWGKTGHYKIAAKACELPDDERLRKLLMNNQELIAFSDDSIKNGDLKIIDVNMFVSLADVPDLVWRKTRKKDAANHFADMDEEGKEEFKSKTLLELCKDENNIKPEVWEKFYDSLEVGYKRGALPFRVWQIFDEMVEFLKNEEVDKFICAGGIMSHYVGDACQPLHVSHLHHGRPGKDEEKVHSIYETNMLDKKAVDIIAGVNEILKNQTVNPSIKNGKEAASIVIELMRNTIETLPPIEVINAYNDSDGNRIDYMWEKVGKKTNECIAEGCKTLGVLWASAWKEGNGKDINDNKLVIQDKDKLKEIYNDKSFIESNWLKDMVLK